MSHICDICHIYVTFDPYAVQSAFLALRSTPNVCNWCQDKAMKMALKVDGFSALPFALNIEYGGNFKGGVPPLMEV